MAESYGEVCFTQFWVVAIFKLYRLLCHCSPKVVFWSVWMKKIGGTGWPSTPGKQPLHWRLTFNKQNT